MDLRPAKQGGGVLAWPAHGHGGAAAALRCHGVAPGLWRGVALCNAKF